MPRPQGSGKPKGYKSPKTLGKEEAREALRAIVMAHMQDMVAAQVANAKGLKYLVARDKKTGKFERLTEAEVKCLLAGQESERALIEVWEKDPSVQAFTDLMNRALDKPKEQEQGHVISGALMVKWEDE